MTISGFIGLYRIWIVLNLGPQKTQTNHDQPKLVSKEFGFVTEASFASKTQSSIKFPPAQCAYPTHFTHAPSQPNTPAWFICSSNLPCRMSARIVMSGTANCSCGHPKVARCGGIYNGHGGNSNYHDAKCSKGFCRMFHNFT